VLHAHRYDIKAIQKQPTGNDDLKVFYLHMVEHICHRLDHMTMQAQPPLAYLLP
tara:strand:+ start:73 stop:234 length:162 start_codon:yes stop_codon:yes gene_type:complete